MSVPMILFQFLTNVVLLPCKLILNYYLNPVSIGTDDHLQGSNVTEGFLRE